MIKPNNKEIDSTIIAIIIVTFNSEKYIKECLNSVYSSQTNLKYDVIVVDNNSIDLTASVIEQNFPKVHLVKNSQNLGFAKANNQAIKIAKGKYLFLLNPDTEITKETIERFYSFMQTEENKNVWCVGGILKDEYGNPQFSYW